MIKYLSTTDEKKLLRMICDYSDAFGNIEEKWVTPKGEAETRALEAGILPIAYMY